MEEQQTISVKTSPGGTFTMHKGKPLPLGAEPTATGVNFAIFSRNASGATLCLFPPDETGGEIKINLDSSKNRTGDIWHIHIDGFPDDWGYGWRFTGPYSPDKTGHRFNPNKLLIDPYAKALKGSFTWDSPTLLGYELDHDDLSFSTEDSAPFVPKCLVVRDDFDWEDDRPPRTPLKDSIIYEVHVKGFTCSGTSSVKHPGTYSGFMEKIPYLKELGVTAVELLPIFEFNENENTRVNPETDKRLKNYWGYSTCGFFAPKASYAVDGDPVQAIREFKELVKELHKHDIEVILDVVYNHTAEGDQLGPTISFRGIDNTLYYMLDESQRFYRNFSGCGNTLNCNHPVVRSFVVNSLHYWVVEMHVDGFRFDLASILGRARDGRVLKNPPLLEQIAHDPVLANCKLIAEAWDAAGLYQVGSFPSEGRWAEWNGRYRDDIRSFVRGDDKTAPAAATRITGSSDLYQHDGRAPYHSINFVCSHDGFTMNDLVSYNRKHNKANGEENKDGHNHTLSWNCGTEGPTSDPLTETLRLRQIKNFWTILMISQGVPMVLGGDEFRRTQKGNNNAYCQDNELSWFNWDLLLQHDEINRFARGMIRFRKHHPALRRYSFLAGKSDGSNAAKDIVWFDPDLKKPKWDQQDSFLAFMLNGSKKHTLAPYDSHDLYIILNMGKETLQCTLPAPRDEHTWLQAVDTSKPPPADLREPGEEKPLRTDNSYKVHAHSSVVLVSC